MKAPKPASDDPKEPIELWLKVAALRSAMRHPVAADRAKMVAARMHDFIAEDIDTLQSLYDASPKSEGMRAAIERLTRERDDALAVPQNEALARMHKRRADELAATLAPLPPGQANQGIDATETQVEAAAIALWRDEPSDFSQAATRARAEAVWGDENIHVRERWMKIARVAIAAYLSALPAVPLPHGWKMVPVKPTMDMTEAGWPQAFDPDGPQNVNAVYRAMLSASPLPPNAGEVTATHRHKKRGTEYELLGFGTWVSLDVGSNEADAYVAEMAPGVWHIRWAFGEVEGAEWARVQTATPFANGTVLAIYRSVDGAMLWVRPREEFEDGRFEALAPLPVKASEAGEPVAWRWRSKTGRSDWQVESSSRMLPSHYEVQPLYAGPSKTQGGGE